MGKIPGAGRQTCGYQRDDISQFTGAAEEREIPGAQPPSCPWGCLKPRPVLMAARAFPPLLGKSLHIILASCCPHRDLTLERVLQLWLWEQSLEK